MQTSSEQDPSFPTLLTIEQFYLIGFQNYSQSIFAMIFRHLHHKQQSFPFPDKEDQTSIPYQGTSNEEITRRGYFLNIFYQYTVSMKPILNQFNCYLEKMGNEQKLDYKCWLENMVLPMEVLQKIKTTREMLKKSNDSQIKTFKDALIQILFDTELYVLQILIRIVLFKKSLEISQQYFEELAQLNNRFQEYMKEEERNSMRKILNKHTLFQIEQRKLIKQVEQIATFYQLDLSLYRSSAKEKPEMKCLFELLRSKIEKDTLFKVLKGTKQFKDMYKEEMQFAKPVSFSPFILRPIKTVSEESPNAISQNRKILKVQKQQFMHISPSIEHQIDQIDLKKIDRSQDVLTPEKSRREQEKSSHNNSEKKNSNNNNNNKEIKTSNKVPVHSSPPKTPSNQTPRESRSQTSKSNPQKDQQKTPKDQKSKSFYSNLNNKQPTQKINDMVSSQKLKYTSMNKRFSSSTSNMLARMIKPRKEKQNLSNDSTDKDPKYVYQKRQQPQKDLIDSGSVHFSILADETPKERQDSLEYQQSE